MRCNICDSALSKPDYNSELQAYEPCPTCLDVIQDTLDGFKDVPFIIDEELGDIVSLESLMNTSDEAYFPFD